MQKVEDKPPSDHSFQPKQSLPPTPTRKHSYSSSQSSRMISKGSPKISADKNVISTGENNEAVSKPNSKSDVENIVTSRVRKHSNNLSGHKEGGKSNVKLQILSSFGIDQTEVLLDDFKCSNVRARVPIQGRLYITQYHVCFYSNLLSLEHRLVIRAKDIVHIQKRDERSIFIVTLNNKQNGEPNLEQNFIFVSHRTRDEAFDYLECLEMSKVSLDAIAENSASKKLSQPEHRNIDNVNDSLAKSSVSDNGNSDDENDAANSSSDDGQEKDDENHISGLSPIDLPVGQSIISAPPALLEADLEKIPRVAQVTLQNITMSKMFRLFFCDSPCPFGIAEYGLLVKEYDHNIEKWAVCPMLGGGSGYCLKRIVRFKRTIPKNPIATQNFVSITATLHIFAYGNIDQLSLYYHCSTLSEGVLYSDSFTTETRWVMNSVGHNTVKVAMHGDLFYTKTVNFIVKPIITKKTRAEMTAALVIWTQEAPRIIREHDASQISHKDSQKKKKTKAPKTVSPGFEAKFVNLLAKVASLEEKIQAAEAATNVQERKWADTMAELPWPVIAKIFFVLFVLVFLYRIDRSMANLHSYILGMQHSCQALKD